MQSHFINGKWLKGEGDEIKSFDPATQQIIWQGFAATKKHVDAAVESARHAFNDWSEKNFEDRLHYLRNFQRLAEENLLELANTISQEVGKPLWEAKTEVQTMIAKLDISYQAYQERTGKREQQVLMGLSQTSHQANGVMAVFGPFNFPAHLPNGHIIPALLAGNTVVLKPSELTPKVAEFTVKLWEKAELPAGVINLVQGDVETGKALINSDIDGVLFTGSYQTGRFIHQQLAGHLEKIIVLELGGNNPLVVWDVSDLLAAAYHIIQSSFLTSGQRCTCARRLIIQEGKAGDELLEKLISMSRSLTIAPYTTNPEPFMGSLISANAAENVLNKQNLLRSKQCPILLESQQLHYSPAFVSPGIIDVTHCKDLADEEVFGPQLLVFRCKDFQAAIKQANATRYGLSAGLLSDRKELFEQFRREIKAGTINWNRPLTGASGSAPFGGLGYSGNFRPAGYYAADYCAHPVASIVSETLQLPQQITPGLSL